jgi:hypothetical protein
MLSEYTSVLSASNGGPLKKSVSDRYIGYKHGSGGTV